MSCGKKVGGNCSLCNEWTGPLIVRCPKPFSNHSSLPRRVQLYVPYKELTPREGRDPDDWQHLVQLKKEHGSGRLVLTDPESVAAFSDRFIVKSKFVVDFIQDLEVMDFKKKTERTEERAKESRKTRRTEERIKESRKTRRTEERIKESRKTRRTEVRVKESRKTRRTEERVKESKKTRRTEERVKESRKTRRTVERAKESRKTRKKSNDDHAWEELCEGSTGLKQFRLPELNNYQRLN